MFLIHMDGSDGKWNVSFSLMGVAEFQSVTTQSSRVQGVNPGLGGLPGGG